MAGRKRAANRRSIDPGVASIAAAAVAAVALVSVAIVGQLGGDTATEVPPIATSEAASTATSEAVPTATSEAVPTATSEAVPTATSEAVPTATSEAVPTATSGAVPTTTPEAAPTDNVPTVQIISSLSETVQDTLRPVVTAFRDAAEQLPLVVNDDFIANEYGWPTGKDVYEGGLTCIRSVGDGLHSITIMTATKGGSCSSALDKRLGSFSLRLDVEFDRSAVAFGSVSYRVNDEATSYYLLKFQPGTKSIALSVVVDGVLTPILGDTFVDDLLHTGTNRIDLVVIGTGHLVYVNGQLAVMVTGESTITDAGSISVAVTLAEPEASLTMSVSRFEARGTDQPIDS